MNVKIIKEIWIYRILLVINAMILLMQELVEMRIIKKMILTVGSVFKMTRFQSTFDLIFIKRK